MPDGWEVARGFNPLVHEGEKAMKFDPDGDGMINREELIAGTDPFNADSNLKLEARSIPEGIRLSWIAQPNIQYRLTTSDQVNGPYIVLGENHSHNGDNAIEMKISLNWTAKPNNKPESYFQIQISP